MQHAIGRSIVCAVFVSLSATQLRAQGDADAVIVTATRFPEKALAAPIGTRIITADDIANSTATNLPELLGKLGGLQVRNNSGSPDLQLDMRGFGATGDDNTLVLVDGIRVDRLDQATRPLSGIPLQMIERIEILPGGGAVQYGAGASGGTINIITKTPQAMKNEAIVSAGVGSHDTNEQRAFLSAAKGAFGTTLAATRYRSDNYRDHNEVRQGSGIGNFQWRNEDTKAALRVGMDSQTLQFPGERNPQQVKNDPRGTSKFHDDGNRSTGFAALSGSTRSGSVETALDIGYREGDTEALFDRGIFGVDLPSSEYWVQSFSPRLRWNTAMNGMPTQVVAGFDWYRSNYENDSVFDGFPSNWEVDEQSQAFFAQLSADLSKTTRLNLGWRKQRLDTERHDLISDAEAEETRNLYASDIGLRQGFLDRWAIHLKWSRSFRTANVDENNFFMGSEELLKPQTAKQTELGLEYRASALRASLVLYDMKLKNEIATALFDFGGGFILAANTNLPPTRKKGVEFSASWFPTATLEFGTGLNYTRSTFESGVFAGVDVSGNEVPLVPRWRASLSMAWEFMPATRFSANYSYTGEQRYDNDQPNAFRKMPDYDLLDLRLSRRQGAWLFAVNINNALDEAYYNYAVISTSLPTFNAYPQAERTVFVSAEYTFH